MSVTLQRFHRSSMMVVGFALLLAGCSVWLDQVRGLQRDAGSEAGSLVFDGRIRTYLLHLPPAYEGTAPLPLVMFLHGGGGNAQGAVSRYGFNEVADREGFIVAYPNGMGVFRDQLLTWNAGHCCGYALERGVNDVGFLRALIEKLEAELNVDPKRVYVTGHSNGCDPTAQTQTSASVIVETYVGCAGGSEVTLYTVTNGGHSWPGSAFGELQTQEISATEEVWEFFARHLK